MKRADFDIAAGLVDRIDKLEAVIFKLEEIRDKKNYAILASNDDIIFTGEKLGDVYGSVDDKLAKQYRVKLNAGEIATEVFIQDILELYLNTLNLELDELRKSFDELA